MREPLGNHIRSILTRLRCVRLGIALSLALVSVVKAQVTHPRPLVPEQNALAVGAIAKGVTRDAYETPRATSTTESLPRLVPNDSSTFHHRQSFATGGAVVGAVGGAAWAIHSARDNNASRAVIVLLIPLPMLVGGIIGGAAGYGLSFVF